MSSGKGLQVAKLEHVRFSYDGGATWALDDVSLSVEAGECLCLLGANGSGKSTLARLLVGILAPDEGTVELMGRTCFVDGAPDGEAYQRARDRSAMVFQTPEDAILTTRVDQDVAFGPENLGWDPAAIDQAVDGALEATHLETLASQDPTRLSGGQQQRVAIAGALACDPTLLVLDEPGARLDVEGRRQVAATLASLGAQHACVLVTHSMDEAAAADRIVVLSQGKIALQGAPEQVLTQASRLASLSLEPPFAASLALALARSGMPVSPTVSAAALLDQLAGGAS